VSLVQSFVDSLCVFRERSRGKRAPRVSLPCNQVVLCNEVKGASIRKRVCLCLALLTGNAATARARSQPLPAEACLLPAPLLSKHISGSTHHCVCVLVYCGVCTTEGYQKRPKLGLYGESGVECSVEGAQTDVRERGPGSASSATEARQACVARERLSGGVRCAAVATPAFTLRCRFLDFMCVMFEGIEPVCPGLRSVYAAFASLPPTKHINLRKTEPPSLLISRC
jgi:hypothetical protein